MSKPEPKGRGRGTGKASGKAAGKAAGQTPGKKSAEGARKRKAAAGVAADLEKHPLQTTRGLFAADLGSMMYGHGDHEQPLQETIDVVEDIVVNYVVDIAQKAASDKPTIGAQDFMWVLRKDRPKLDRGRELLAKKKEIDEARKALDDRDPASYGEENAQ